MSPAVAEQILGAQEGYLLGEGLLSGPNQFPTAFVALNVILDQPDAVAVFERVSESGTPAAQLWALSGLRLRGAPSAKALQLKLEQSKESVWAGMGCVLSKSSVATFAREVGGSRPQTWLRAGRNPTYAYLDGLANKRLNAAAASVMGVASATPLPAAAAR